MSPIEQTSILNKYPANEKLFRAAGHKFGADYYIDNSCLFGIPHDGNPLPFFHQIPPYTKGLYSYYANKSSDIVKLIADLKINEHLEHMTLGLNIRNGLKDFDFTDYTELSQVLASINFPNLKTFDYGIDFSWLNCDECFPFLGNITRALENMPAIENLYLSGSFEMDNSLHFSSLKNINISTFWVWDEKIDRIQNATLHHFFGSQFDHLEEIEIDLTLVYEDKREPYTYTFNESFFTPDNIGHLRSLYIKGPFAAGTKDMLNHHLKGKVEKLYLSEIREE